MQIKVWKINEVLLESWERDEMRIELWERKEVLIEVWGSLRKVVSRIILRIREDNNRLFKSNLFIVYL